MLCNKCTQASLVGTTHGVDHFAAPEEQESRHRCHTKLLRKLAEHIHINFDADGGVGILVSKRGKRRCDALGVSTRVRGPFLAGVKVETCAPVRHVGENDGGR